MPTFKIELRAAAPLSATLNVQVGDDFDKESYEARYRMMHAAYEKLAPLIRLRHASEPDEERMHKWIGPTDEPPTALLAGGELVMALGTEESSKEPITYHSFKETLEKFTGGSEPRKEPITCHECGGRFHRIAKEGRTTSHRGIPGFIVPADLELLTCNKCGQELMNAEDERKLDEAREKQIRFKLPAEYIVDLLNLEKLHGAGLTSLVELIKVVQKAAYEEGSIDGLDYYRSPGTRSPVGLYSRFFESDKTKASMERFTPLSDMQKKENE